MKYSQINIHNITSSFGVQKYPIKLIKIHTYEFQRKTSHFLSCLYNLKYKSYTNIILSLKVNKYLDMVDVKMLI